MGRISELIVRELLNGINSAPAEHCVWGTVDIKRGLKRHARNRKVRIDAEMKEVIARLMKVSQCRYGYTQNRSTE